MNQDEIESLKQSERELFWETGRLRQRAEAAEAERDKLRRALDTIMDGMVKFVGEMEKLNVGYKLDEFKQLIKPWLEDREKRRQRAVTPGPPL